MNYPWLDEYFFTKKGVTKDFKMEWDAHRFLISNKMCGMLSHDKEKNDIITLKCDPAFGEAVRSEYNDIKPGYYMNKIHWNSVDLNGSVPDEILKQMIDNSYELVLSSLTKKAQKEILEK